MIIDYKIDSFWMKYAIKLAKEKGRVNNKPLVGSVIVDKDGEKIGEGYGIQGSHLHAEVMALRQAGEKAKNSTLYSTLEPCIEELTKTFPEYYSSCVSEIIKSGISRVVVGAIDPHPIVNGKGIEQLRKAGVEIGMAEEDEARDMIFNWISKFKKQYKIAVFGAAKEELSKDVYKIAEEVGAEIAKRGHTLVTGAATGVSRFAAKGARQEKGCVIGISPTSDDSEKDKYNVFFENIDVIIHTGAGYKGRNVIGVRTCDAMIIVNGNFGTLSEVANGEGEQKPIIGIKNSGGCANMLDDIFKKLNAEYQYFAMAENAKEAVDLIEEMKNCII